MGNIRIPPQLQVAESVTEEEYGRAIRQNRIVLICAIAAGLASAIPVVWLFGVLIGLPAAGIAGALAERIMSAVFKDAKKAKTQRIRQYKELKAFKERHGLP